MVATDYVYSLSSDFGGLINSRVLQDAIDSDGIITKVINFVTVVGTTVTINFADALSGAEVTQLDVLIAAHNGTASGVSLDREIVTFKGTGGQGLQGAGVRDYGPSATAPTDPTPQAGDRFYHTGHDCEFYYDGTRSKWLSDAVRTEPFGSTGTIQATEYYSRIAGVVLAPALGTFVETGTVVQISYNNVSAVTFTVEVIVGGVAVAELASGGAAAASDTSLNGDFSQGVLAMRHKSGSNDTLNLQGTVSYKLRP